LCILVSAGFFCQHYAAALVDFLPLYIGMGIKNINDCKKIMQCANWYFESTLKHFQMTFKLFKFFQLLTKKRLT
jgi:hypothetical protein